MRFLGFFAVVLLAVVALADDKTFDSSFIAVVGNGTVYNSAVGTLKNEKFTIQTPSNLEGPVTVALSQTVTTKTIQICFSLVPIATSSNLENACAGYTFITLSNSTKSKDLEVKDARKSFSAFSSTKRLSSRFVNAAEVVEATPASATVQLRPSSQYYVVVASPDSSSSVLVTVLLNGDVCPEENQFGIGCPTINKPLVPGKATDFEAEGGYTYFSAGTFAENVGSVTFTVAPAAAAAAATFTLRAQLGALPSDSSYSTNVTGSNTNTLTIPSPYAGGAQWYIGVLNSGEDVADAVITQVNTVCAANTFGYNCSQTVSNITNIAATNWTVWSVKANNNPTGYTYFKLTNTGALGVDASVVRVSVAPSSGNVAPAVLAGYGYAPNPSNYEVSTSGNYVNQVFLPINNQPADDAEQAAVFAADRWYIGVQSNQDFKIWAGANCANNCTGSKGTCTCDGLPCTFNTVYRLPSSTDSQGQCTCSSSSSDNNFDCSSKKSSESPLRTVYIVLIAVGGAIVLAVAIGVPVYCYLQNRKRGNYERV